MRFWIRNNIHNTVVEIEAEPVAVFTGDGQRIALLGQKDYDRLLEKNDCHNSYCKCRNFTFPIFCNEVDEVYIPDPKEKN